MFRAIEFLFRAATLGPYYGFIVRRSVKHVLQDERVARHRVERWIHYGATYIDPKHLAIWFLTRSNEELNEAKTQGLEGFLTTETRQALVRNGYPAAAASHVHVGLESVENVERGGGWMRYFR